MSERPSEATALAATFGDQHAVAPRPLVVAAAWGWRLIVVGIVLRAVGQLLARIPSLVVALAVALLLCVLLAPVVSWLKRHHWPALLAATATALGFMVATGALMTIVVDAVSSGLTGAPERIAEGWSQLVQWLADGPLHINAAQLSAWGTQVEQWLTTHAGDLTQKVWTVGSFALEFVVGALICLLATIMLLTDGRRIWTQFTQLFPEQTRRSLLRSGSSGWQALGAYLRTQLVIALLEGIAIAVGAVILGVQSAAAMGLLVFITATAPETAARYSSGEAYHACPSAMAIMTTRMKSADRP